MPSLQRRSINRALWPSRDSQTGELKHSEIIIPDLDVKKKQKNKTRNEKDINISLSTVFF